MSHLDARCGPHCGAMTTPTSAEKRNPPIVGHCERCHEEYDFPMRTRPGHGPGAVRSG